MALVDVEVAEEADLLVLVLQEVEAVGEADLHLQLVVVEGLVADADESRALLQLELLEPALAVVLLHVNTLMQHAPLRQELDELAHGPLLRSLRRIDTVQLVMREHIFNVAIIFVNFPSGFQVFPALPLAL